MVTPPKVESVLQAVEADLRELEAAGLPVGTRAMAATARALARDLDSDAVSATAKASGARALQDVMDGLRALVPRGGAGVCEEGGDSVDELRRRRAARRR